MLTQISFLRTSFPGSESNLKVWFWVIIRDLFPGKTGMGVRDAGQEATQGCPGSRFSLSHPKPTVLVKGCPEWYEFPGISLVRAQWPVRAQGSPPNYMCRCWRPKYIKTWGHKNSKKRSGRSGGALTPSSALLKLGLLNLVQTGSFSAAGNPSFKGTSFSLGPICGQIIHLWSIAMDKRVWEVQEAQNQAYFLQRPGAQRSPHSTSHTAHWPAADSSR